MNSVVGMAPLPKRTFGARIAERMRTAILSGEVLPGSAIVETALAGQFGVSRGPLREAMRQLVDEGLLVQVPFTGTRVIDLSAKDVLEIYSMRTTLETFAFELVWDKRDAEFCDELNRRQLLLNEAIDRGDEIGSIERELNLHSLVFEASGHQMLMQMWTMLRGRLQLYWAANHLAHGRRGPKRDGHDSYLEAACGDNLDTMRSELKDHMQRGAEVTERFILEREQLLQRDDLPARTDLAEKGLAEPVPR